MNYKLKKYETFQITGRGTVFAVHRDENDVEGIKVGSTVETDDGKIYDVIGIEMFTNTFSIGKNIGLLVKLLTFETTAVLNNDHYHHFGIHEITAAVYGDDPKNIEKIKLCVSDDQSIPEPNQKFDKADYWGWYDSNDKEFTNLIYPQRFLLNMCFPSGIEASEKAGQGKAYRLEVINK